MSFQSFFKSIIKTSALTSLGISSSIALAPEIKAENFNMAACPEPGSANATLVSHSHTINQHTHSFTTNGDGSHTHNLLYNHGAFGGTSGAVTPRSGNTPVTPGITGRISTVGNHTHSGTTNAGTASGTTGGSTPGTNSQGSSATNANLPPYYALCYIMKS